MPINRGRPNIISSRQKIISQSKVTMLKDKLNILKTFYLDPKQKIVSFANPLFSMQIYIYI
jgi:hypothetical protein